jgi:hypothetical protein
MTGAGVESVGVEWHVPPESEAELREELTTAGAGEIEIKQPGPDEMVVTTIIGVVVALGVLSEVVMRWKDKHRCQQTITVGEKVTTDLNCEIRDGRIIIVTADGKVEIVEAPPSAVDFTAILEAAMSGGAAAAKKAAQAAGAKLA